MNERQRIARYEREMAALYQEMDALRREVGQPCPICTRRHRLEGVSQGAGINWEKLSADRSSMLRNREGSRGSAR